MQDGGGTIRMKGIVNALAQAGKKVTLLSNAKHHDEFHPSVEHVFIDMNLSKKDKRIFQFLLSFLPTVITKQVFKHYSQKLEQILKKEKLTNQTIVYFEYLDNSMAYFLKEQKIIVDYINDTHGIAPLEFLHKSTNTLIDTIINRLKYKMALKLDSKIINSAKGMIFVSEAMKRYYQQHFSTIQSKEIYILRDGVNISLCHQCVEPSIVAKYKKNFGILPDDKIIMFAGNFKDLGGILDLLKAFRLLVSEKKMRDIKLLLLGDGERYEEAKRFVENHALQDKVIFVGRTLYSQLKNYQELASLIVCPDKQHPFSELVPHIKYFDSLASGKVVINGAFSSVKEMNQNENFSVEFEPSNILDLTDKIEMVLVDLEYFGLKYKKNKQIICSEFSYNNFAKVLSK